MDVTVREAAPEDVPALDILRRQAVQAAVRGEYDPARVADIVAEAGAALDAIVDAPDHSVVLIETEVTVVGFASVDTSSWEILGIYTSPDYQGEGFASQVLARVREDAADAGATALTTTAPDSAVGFFESVGFDRTGSTTWHGVPAAELRLATR